MQPDGFTTGETIAKSKDKRRGRTVMMADRKQGWKAMWLKRDNVLMPNP